MLGGGDAVPERRVHYHDAARGGGRDVDIVHADAGATDHLQILGVVEQLGRRLGRRADGEAVIIADDGGKLVRSFAGDLVYLDPAFTEDGGGARVHLVGNQYARGHARV